MKDGFKAPPKASPSPRSKRASRRLAKERDSAPRPDQSKVFRQPPQLPTAENKNSTPAAFIVPQGLSSEPGARRSSKSNKSSQERRPFNTPNLQAIKDMRGRADNVQAKLKVQLEAPASSATTSSGPSLESLEFDIEDGNSSSSLSSAPEVQEFNALDCDWLKDHPPSSPKMQCPICKSFVSRLFMEEFSGSRTHNLRQQVQFCKAHKIRSAEAVWRAKTYPRIDWQQFTERLPNYENTIIGILTGTRESFYRNAFEDQIKSGANRTLQQSMMSGSGWEGLNMGYYGTKGARILYVSLSF